ncbi:uncharacterized protein LOC129218455 [Uloborus diversus]|uniref:uncharacterized protein LOC129218455 n=1 Tax=Uloborus diversus TaxID=327109 RepID=UPI002409AC7E|nr:uncharacterized protein LOC129218455 [Uloborus diversus]
MSSMEMNDNDSELLNDNSVSNDSAAEDISDSQQQTATAEDKSEGLPQRKLKLNRRGFHMADMNNENPDAGEENANSSNVVEAEVKSEKKIIKLTYANGGVGKFWNNGNKSAREKAGTSSSAGYISSSAVASSSTTASSSNAASSSTAHRSRSVYVTDKNVTVNVGNVSEATEPPKKKHKPITWP